MISVLRSIVSFQFNETFIGGIKLVPSCGIAKCARAIKFNIDVNECSVGIENCSQLCNNENGGFSCSCNEGYLLMNDGISCEGKKV